MSKELGDAEAKKLLFRAVYIISVGSNDYAVPFTRNSSIFQSYTPEEYVDMVISNLTFVIEVRKLTIYLLIEASSFYLSCSFTL